MRKEPPGGYGSRYVPSRCLHVTLNSSEGAFQVGIDWHPEILIGLGLRPGRLRGRPKTDTSEDGAIPVCMWLVVRQGLTQRLFLVTGLLVWLVLWHAAGCHYGTSLTRAEAVILVRIQL